LPQRSIDGWWFAPKPCLLCRPQKMGARRRRRSAYFEVRSGEGGRVQRRSRRLANGAGARIIEGRMQGCAWCLVTHYKDDEHRPRSAWRAHSQRRRAVPCQRPTGQLAPIDALGMIRTGRNSFLGSRPPPNRMDTCLISPLGVISLICCLPNVRVQHRRHKSTCFHGYITRPREQKHHIHSAASLESTR